MKSITEINENKRNKRKKKTAEIFTPDSLVNQMLDKSPKEIWKEDEENTFLDPACGNGQFLIWVLWRKLSLGHNPTEALKTISGLDIMADSIKECRLRLLKIINLYEKITKEHIQTVFTNIRCLNTKRWPKGSLDYDMSFKPYCNSKIIDKWFKNINKEIKLVDIPFEDINISPSKNKKREIKISAANSIKKK